MITEFEQALANALGSRLAAPFGGVVQVAPGTGGGATPRIIVGVQRSEPVVSDFRTIRSEIVPGSLERRRILRLRCQIGLEVRAATGSGRSQQVQGVDALLYLLNAPELRNGSAITGGADPGFLVQQLQVIESQAPLDPTVADAPAVGVTAQAEGWFWPVGVSGESGRQIGEIRIREVILPLEISPAAPETTAGGAAVDLTFRLGTVGVLRLQSGAAPLPALPFGSLALALFGPGGTPGAGSLSGGVAGTAGVQLATLSAGGEAVIRYTPPAQEATDELRIALDNGIGGPGIEIGRVSVRVREA